MKEKIIIIGGSSGIGLSLAKMFDTLSFNLCVIGRNTEKSQKFFYSKDTELISLDITNEELVGEFLRSKKSSKITKIANCVGVFSNNKNALYYRKYRRTKEDGIFLVKKLLKKNNVTHVVSISSLYTFLPEYLAPKFETGVQKYVENETLKLSNRVIANCVAPGLTKTPIVVDNYSQKEIDYILSQSKGASIIEPDYVAGIIASLLFQQEINGKVIPADNGYLNNLIIKNSS